MKTHDLLPLLYKAEQSIAENHYSLDEVHLTIALGIYADASVLEVTAAQLHSYEACLKCVQQFDTDKLLSEGEQKYVAKLLKAITPVLDEMLGL